MDLGDDVQEENLIDDQVAQALVDSGAAPTPQVVTHSSPMASAPTQVPTVAVPEALPLTGPLPDEPEVAPTPTPLVPTPADVAPTPAAIEITDSTPAPTPLPTPSVPVSSAELNSGSGDDNELMRVKQKALEQLSPLVSHLELPADQKFDTYMEIIRASDDKTLIQPAFETAQQIQDEDKKAQALLDVVNEVNYLTQEHSGEDKIV